jgi:hypothetical protein
MTIPYNPKSGTTDVAQLQQQLEDMDRRLKLLESALQVSASEVWLRANGKTLRIEGDRETLLRASTTLRLQGPQIHLN